MCVCSNGFGCGWYNGFGCGWSKMVLAVDGIKWFGLEDGAIVRLADDKIV
jgi:hypothetical protein